MFSKICAAHPIFICVGTEARGSLNKSNVDFGNFECVFLSTPDVWLSDCDGLVLLVLVLLCASITIPLLFKVSIEDINITPKIAIRTMILNSLFETRVLILFLFFTLT
jgi:hypothetical protein